QQVGVFDLLFDPRVVHVGHGAAGRAVDGQVVDHGLDAFGAQRDVLGALLGGGGVGHAGQGHHAVVRGHLDVQAVGVLVPQEHRVDVGGQFRVGHHLRVAAHRGDGGHHDQLGVHPQLVVDGRDALGAVGDQPGEGFLADGLDHAGQGDGVAFHVDVDVAGIQDGGGGVGRPYLAV